MTAVVIAGDITFNSLIYLHKFPQPRPQTLFSTGFNETVGGTAAGKALNLHRLGLDVTLHGLIGNDLPGQYIRDLFARENLTLIADIDPKGTQRHVNLMAEDGGRISIYVQYATFEPAIDLSRLDAEIAQSDLVVLNLSNYCRRLIPLAKQHDKPIWCDIHDYDGKNDYHRDFIEGADVLTMSSDAMPHYKSFMERLIAEGKQLVVCTHGRAGATALTADGEWITAPALTSYEQRDTNGAGDSFFAGLLYGFTQEYALEKCLRLGAIVAGLCVTSEELFYPELSVQTVEFEYARHFG
jgi:sugar/nucleoside kinase (ribokinase family)